MNPPPSAVLVHRRACTAPLVFRASSQRSLSPGSSGILPSFIIRNRAPYVLTLLNPWSCTPMWVRWGAMRSRVPRRPTRRNSSSPVASNWRSEEPYWNPWVHSVQPREVQAPLTVHTGEPRDSSYVRAIARILRPETSHIRDIFFERSGSAGAACGCMERSLYAGSGGFNATVVSCPHALPRRARCPQGCPHPGNSPHGSRAHGTAGHRHAAQLHGSEVVAVRAELMGYP